MYALLLAVAATVTPEIRLADVVPRGVFQPARIGVAAAGDGGFAVAWTALNAVQRPRVFVARFDVRGNRIGAAREIAPLSPNSYQAGEPSIAAFGDGFLLGWIEDCASPKICAAAQRLDGALNPITPSVALLADGAPVTVRSFAGRTVVAAGELVFLVIADGKIGDVLPNSKLVEGIAVNQGGAVAAVSHRNAGSLLCVPALSGPQCFLAEDHLLDFTWIGTSSFTRSYGRFFVKQAPPFAPQPAIASNGCCFLMVWTELLTPGARVVGASIDAPLAAQAQISAPMNIAFVDAAVQADVASDGERYLVVWSAGDHAVAGATVEDGGMQPLAIGGRADGVPPVVAALGHDRFIVVYTDGAAIFARLVGFAARSRGRAVR